MDEFVENAKRGRVRLVLPSRKMMTRQGRKTDDMEDRIIATLKDAGIDNVETMSEEEKNSLFEAIQSSMVASPKANDEYFQRDSPGSPGDHPALSPNPDSQNSNNDVVMEENVARPSRSTASGQPGSSQPPKSAGRGRGKPVKTKYPTLPFNAPGQKPDLVSSTSVGSKINSSSNSFASATSAQSPSSVRSSESPPPTLENNAHRSTDDTAAFADSPSPPSHSLNRPSSPDFFSPMEHDMGVSTASVDLGGAEKEVSNSDDDILVDIESSTPEEGGVRDSQPDSPASVQDAGEDEKEPLKTVLIGKNAVQVSPLESMNRDFPSNGYPSFFQELEKYRGNKAEWMAKANEKVKEQRMALWKRLKEDNPIWGPPITDGGSFNKRTLFKETSPTPKYSQLFSNSSEKQAGITIASGRIDRQSKTRAVSKIQEVINSPEWGEDKFRSLRRSKQNPTGSQDHGNRPTNNAWQSRIQQDDESNDESCREVTPSVAEKWPSNRLEQRGRSADGDYDFPSEPQKPSADVYTYDENDEDENDHSNDIDNDEIWEPVANRARKSFNKKGGRSVQGNAEPDTKMPPRPRGAGAPQQTQRQRNTKLRLQKGAIAHPSQHGPNARHKGGSSDQMEGETNARNSANNDGRWIRTDSADNESAEIPSKSFYPPKVVQPRNSTARRSGDNLRSTEFSPAPSTSGDSPAQQCPICEKMFPADKIETHASDCNRFQDTLAVGEKSESEDQESQEPDKAVNELKNIESVKSNEETKEASMYSCEQCKGEFSKQIIINHVKKCISSNPSKKRANSIDDGGPVKKTRCVE